MKVRNQIHLAIGLGAIALALVWPIHDARASEPDKPHLLVSIAAMGNSISHAIAAFPSKKECEKARLALVAVMENFASQGAAACSEIKEPDEKPKLNLKKERDS